MNVLPTDLVPLPTAPWAIRPSDLPLDIEEVRTAIWLCDGNSSDVAEMLKVSPARTRAFIGGSEYLSREKLDAEEGLKDIAERNVKDALTDQKDSGRRDTMTRWFLERKGKDRGYSTASGPKNGKLSGKIVVLWDGEEETQDGAGNVIEGTVVAANDR